MSFKKAIVIRNIRNLLCTEYRKKPNDTTSLYTVQLKCKIIKNKKKVKKNWKSIYAKRSVKKRSESETDWALSLENSYEHELLIN